MTIANALLMSGIPGKPRSFWGCLSWVEIRPGHSVLVTATDNRCATEGFDRYVPNNGREESKSPHTGSCGVAVFPLYRHVYPSHSIRCIGVTTHRRADSNPVIQSPGNFEDVEGSIVKFDE